MKIALISATKPELGTGDKVTEYTYQLYKHLSRYKDNRVDMIYALGETRRLNTIGLIYTNTIFRNRIPGLIKENYDVIHVTNHEVGFAAKILRNGGERCTIVTTLHDTMRMRNDLHRGIRQKMYNNLTTLNIRNALETSDLMIFDDDETKREVSALHEIKKYAIIPLGVKDPLIKEPIKRRVAKRKFVIGYMGSLLPNKNLMLILKAANLLKRDSNYKFEIYGRGVELDNLMAYKSSNLLDNVEFRGFAPEQKLVEVYDSFDAFVFPALGETFTLSILEAFARGLPVIIDARAKYVDVIKRYCAEAKDEHDLVAKIKMLREGRDPKIIKEEMNYARSLTWERTVKETFDAYKKLVEK